MSSIFRHSAVRGGVLVLAFGAIAAIVLAPRSAPADRSDYVGSDTCGACHKAEYDKWLRTAHARATTALASTFRRDPRCAGCHATDLLGEIPEVGCESCHGAGRFYYPAYVMRDAEVARALGLAEAGEATCKTCHGADSPAVRPFDYKEAWKRIAHGTPK